MPSFCSVFKCGMRGERDKVSFFRFPAVLTKRGDYLNALSVQRRDAWISALKRGPLSEPQLKTWRVCSRHFIEGKPSALEQNMHPDWIPTQNMGYTTSGKPDESATSRYERSERRKRQKMVIEENTQVIHPQNEVGTTFQMETESMNPEEIAGEISSMEVHENSVSVSVQTDLSEEQFCRVFEDLKFSNSQIYSLQTKLNVLDVSEDSFKNNDHKTRYFTGLINFEMMIAIHDSVHPYLSSHPNKSMSTFQQFLLTLMKLRLNLPFMYLSYRFAVSPTTVSDTFYKTVDVLYDRFKSFVKWPTREALKNNVPACFKETFGKQVAVIIDCFEVFIETPSQVINASQCWSTYKHHETVKFLIGITPHGTISYISEAWGGRTSDKFLTENCGFLNLILPGDVVLADRGFLIEESLQIIGAHLKIPAFTKGKTQLHPADLESTRNIATVRIHVERIIGLLKKKFHIFQEVIPISVLSHKRGDLSVLDKIVVICSALINLCPSQIPLE